MIRESSSLVIPFAVRAFLIACPIGVKSKSKSLFLASINSPPCINIIFLLYFTEMRVLIERSEIPCDKRYNFYIQEIKAHI